MKSIEVRKFYNICNFDVPSDFLKGFYATWSRHTDNFECFWDIMFGAFSKKGPQNEDKY
jgi:hypothetical protein